MSSRRIQKDKRVVARAVNRDPRIFRLDASVIPNPWPEAKWAEYMPLTGPLCRYHPTMPLDERMRRAAFALRNRALLRLEHDEVNPGEELIIFWDKVVDHEHRLYCTCGDMSSGLLDGLDIINLEPV